MRATIHHPSQPGRIVSDLIESALHSANASALEKINDQHLTNLQPPPTTCYIHLQQQIGKACKVEQAKKWLKPVRSRRKVQNMRPECKEMRPECKEIAFIIN